ncbi:MAG: diaminopimelate epimerase [Desulfobacteraceae bacterium 4572_88]|nr:MAG: diaminopimelate epimerase [Desulfobacteraceae bacterium 4572_88]
MSKISFHKMSGCGNDFIIIDNRTAIVDERNLSDFIRKVCRRKMSVGADGLILIENSQQADFKWRFFNSDGSIAEMCGNGARCAARFACLNDIAGSELSFETDAGVISAQVTNDSVKIKMTDPASLSLDDAIDTESGPLRVSCLNTGVPHVVVEVENIETADVFGIGREIRFHDAFAPKGSNVNFVSETDDGCIINRTYERGVEDETLACGTGCVASAIVMAHKYGRTSPIPVITRSGGILTIHYKKRENASVRFFDIYLEGDARIICNGELLQDSWNYRFPEK